MLRLIADENLKGAIVRGLLVREPELDLVRVQDVGLSGIDDQDILEWAAREGRVVLTQDIRTMPKYAYERIVAGQPMQGVFVIGHSASVRQAIEDILLLARCSLEGEWESQVCYVPLT